jgi:hypothetical protein
MFTFPLDANNRAGAVRVTPDTNYYYVPIVLFNSDGVTPNSASAPAFMKQVGNTLKDYFFGSSAVTKTYGTNKIGFMITNDGTADITVTIGSLSFTVKATETYSSLFDPFTAVTVSATSAYRAWVYE